MMEITDAIISVAIIMGLFCLAYGCVWVLQKIWDRRKSGDIAL